MTGIRLIAMLCVCSGEPAQAQPVRIDPGHQDVSPLSISFKKMEIDQRHPSGFDGVYQFSKVDAFGRGQNLFMRIDGAVTAVFPQSVYVPTRAGLVPDIPPGTVFLIGPTPKGPERKKSPRAETFLDYSVSVQADVEPGKNPRPDPVIHELSIISDESYRQRRIASLLSRAAGE